jgi:hypothetical protein
MTAARAWMLVPALAILLMSSDSVAAQGRGKSNGNGPAFCRNGQGHPVHGWQWCEDKGWDRSSGRIVRRRGRVDDDRRNIGGRRVNIALDEGYSDGYDKGLEDADRNRDFDPTRHGWYRSADRGYKSAYGSKTEYKNVYRQGFRNGYEAGYRDRERNDSRRSGTAIPRRWPF